MEDKKNRPENMAVE